MLRSFGDQQPRVDSQAWVAPDAVIVGDVEIGPDASVWYQTVVRGDVAPVRIGARTNIQDHTTIHVTRDAHPTIIHEDVTVGHRAVLHGCEVRPGALIGIGAIILDDVLVEDGALVAAMALVTPGTRVPAGKLVMGQPARVVRAVNDAERAWMAETIANYVGYAKEHARSRVL